MTVFRIHPSDNVAVALHAVSEGQLFDAGITALSDVQAGHKISLCAIRSGEAVIKYGYPIGVASRDIRPGEHVHTHNLVSAMAGTLQRGGFHSAEQKASSNPAKPVTFDGFRRADGSV